MKDDLNKVGGSAAWAKRKRARLSIGMIVVPRVVYEVGTGGNSYSQSHIKRFAAINRGNKTPAEIRLSRLLYCMNNGAMRGRYKEQHVISGKWIADFFFPEVRLAVEIDGSIHGTPDQIKKDRLKDLDCARFDITIIRLSNAIVLGDRERLLEHLRNGWRLAKRRENRIVGLKRSSWTG